MNQNYNLTTGAFKVFVEPPYTLGETGFLTVRFSSFPDQSYHSPDKTQEYTTNLNFTRINSDFYQLNKTCGFNALLT